MANDNETIDSLLDQTLDDLADVPEFKPFPVGAHVADVTLSTKKIGEHPSFVFKLVAVETQELANPNEDAPLKAGDSTEVAYMQDNELGQGQFKKLAGPLMQHFNVTTLRELHANMQEPLRALIVTTQRADKKKKDKIYTGIDLINPI